ncbi:MAG: OmpA family protein [Comamonadaceae bacterium]|nr:OmpA family protein [Comamonadaceae bacterium]
MHRACRRRRAACALAVLLARLRARRADRSDERTPVAVATPRSRRRGRRRGRRSRRHAAVAAWPPSTWRATRRPRRGRRRAAQRVVYFDFDSFVVKRRVPARASRPRQGAGRRPRASAWSIEGHTDERGGREYNLALGQKRAEAVAQVAGAAGRQRRARSRR